MEASEPKWKEGQAAHSASAASSHIAGLCFPPLFVVLWSFILCMNPYAMILAQPYSPPHPLQVAEHRPISDTCWDIVLLL